MCFPCLIQSVYSFRSAKIKNVTKNINRNNHWYLINMNSKLTLILDYCSLILLWTTGPRWICGVVYLLSARYFFIFFLVSPWWVLCQQEPNFTIFKGQYFATFFTFFENLSKLSQWIFCVTKFSQFFSNICKKHE